MGELRGGVIPGDLPPDEQARVNELLFEHIMSPDAPTGPDTSPPTDTSPTGGRGGEPQHD